MVFALTIGSVMIIGSLAVAIALFGVAMRLLQWMDETNAFGYPRLSLVFDLGVAILWILVVLTSTVWGWAVLYMALGLFDALEPALYFSVVSFTTVGYGDVVLEPGWRLLAGMTATHGLLIFGIFTAFLVEVFRFPTRRRTR
ncbi:MAG: hypothetical protein ACI9PU_001497 [Ascidiaceihabitans sp.]|jgi:hypothetical protein